jgi:cold shock CspA family protein
MTGIIKRFYDAKGFGFVGNEGGEFFFSAADLLDGAAPGDVVEFWLDDDPRQDGKLKAVDVRRVA